jgi:hypothetical protein
LTSSTLAYNKGGTYADYCGVVYAANAGLKCNIEDNIFYNNSLPIQINGRISMDNTNSFCNPLDSAETNTINAILVNTTYPVTTKVNWLETEVAFIITQSTLKVDSSGTLLLGNDVGIKFEKNSALLLSQKDYCLRNGDGPGVIFTSVADDSTIGDSNADAKATLPATDDWKGIFVLNNNGTYSRFKYNNERYSGSDTSFVQTTERY